MKRSDRVKRAIEDYVQKAMDRLREDYYLENIEARLEAKQKYNTRLRLMAIDKLGGPTCVNCACSDIRVLTIDHIKGLEGKPRKHPPTMYREILRMSQKAVNSKYRVLCRNCNWIAYLEREV